MVKTVEINGITNNIVNIQSIETSDNISLTNNEGFMEEKFYFTDLYDDKKMKQFIKGVEKLIRQSPMYENYIGFLVNDIGLDHCAILGNVSKDSAKLEMHHYPFTLYDIVSLNITQKILNKEKFNSFLVAKDIMNDHYNNIIGIIPLSKLAHDLAHSSQIFLSLDNVYGDLNTFIEKYNDSIPDELIEKYNKLVNMTEQEYSYSDIDILKLK